MRRAMAIGGVALLVGMVVIAASSPAGAAPFDNGSFETPSSGTTSYKIVLSGQTIGPWTVTGNSGKSVDWLGQNYPQSNGVQSIELAGSPGPAGVTQTFDTVAGSTYTVAYDVAKRSGCGSSSADVRAFVDENPVDTFTFVANAPEDTFITRTFTFMATKAQTALAFDTTVANPGFSCGTILDNVRVVADTTAVTSTSTSTTSTSTTSTSTTSTSTTSTSTTSTSTTSTSTTSTTAPTPTTSTTAPTPTTSTTAPTPTTSTTAPIPTTSVPPLAQILGDVGRLLGVPATTVTTGPTSTSATTSIPATSTTRPTSTTAVPPRTRLPATGPAHPTQLWGLLMLLTGGGWWFLARSLVGAPATNSDHRSP